MAWAMTRKELAEVAGLSYQRLYTINRDLPKNRQFFRESEEGTKKCDLAFFVQKWVEYNRLQSEADSDDLDVIKAKHEAVKMEKTEIEVSRLKGEYVSVADLLPLWTNIAAEVAERFNNLSEKLAPALVMIRDPEIIAGIIEREVRDAMLPLGTMPLPGMEAEAEEQAADAEE